MCVWGRRKSNVININMPHTSAGTMYICIHRTQVREVLKASLTSVCERCACCCVVCKYQTATAGSIHAIRKQIPYCLPAPPPHLLMRTRSFGHTNPNINTNIAWGFYVSRAFDVVHTLCLVREHHQSFWLCSCGNGAHTRGFHRVVYFVIRPGIHAILYRVFFCITIANGGFLCICNPFRIGCATLHRTLELFVMTNLCVLTLGILILLISVATKKLKYCPMQWTEC